MSNEIKDKIQESIERNRDAVDKVLIKQIREIFFQSGIKNIHLEKDGTLSASYSVVEGLPVTKSVKNLRIEVSDGKIMINGEVTSSTVDEGKII